MGALRQHVTSAQLVEVLLKIARHANANAKALQEHPRGAKPSVKKGCVSGAVGEDTLIIDKVTCQKIACAENIKFLEW